MSEDAFSALAIRAVGPVEWQRGNDFYAVIAIEVRKIAEFRVREDDRKVAPYDYVPVKRSDCAHEPPEVRVEFRRTAGDVYGTDVGPGKHIQALLHGSSGHDSLPVRTGVHMAMITRLIANFPDVDLQNIQIGRSQRRQPRLSQLFAERGDIHFMLKQLELVFGGRQRIPAEGKCFLSHCYKIGRA